MTRNIKILVADDDAQMQLAVRTTLERAGFEVVTVGNGASALENLENDSFDLIISDQKMPELTGSELLTSIQERNITTPFIMITAYGTINQAVEAMQLGAADFITKPFSAEDLLRIIERVLSPESKSFREKKKGRAGKISRPIVTTDSKMIRILEVVEAVAQSDATVLVQGESGTGKELIARLVHSASSRANQSFVAVNCAALPEMLLESELFGHEKGSFTGAQNKKLGKFELAQGGTILLDEISEMALPLQAKLLRVLQEREVDRVGGQQPVSIDVRVVATTNRNLQEMVKEGKFRADLYYRLNVIPVTLPPLRERRSDIKLLVEHFMRQCLGANAAPIPPEILNTLLNYSWPGNVRELQNAVERAAILSRGGEPKESDFLLSPSSTQVEDRLQQVESVSFDTYMPEATIATAVIAQEPSPLQIRSGTTVHEMEKALIYETLKSTNYNRTQAAKMLGISIRTLRNKLHEYEGGSTEVGDGCSDE